MSRRSFGNAGGGLGRSDWRGLAGLITAQRSPFLSYGLAAVVVGIALVLSVIFRGVIGNHFGFLGLAAVIMASLYGGAGPGTLALALAVLAFDYGGKGPAATLASGRTNQFWLLSFFSGAGLLIMYVSSALRNSYRRTEQQKEELRRALGQRDELLSAISHDFRSPLEALRSNNGLLRTLVGTLVPKIDERLSSRFNLADRQISRLTTMIDNLTEMSLAKAGHQALHREKFDLADSVREVAEVMAPQIEAAHCPLKLELNPVVGRWDRFRIDLVLVNLLANAVKYAAGDEITVRVDGVNGSARVAVADKGPGIAPEQLPKLFERSASNPALNGEAPSLGIGLFVAREIIGAHGGTITAQSSPEKGATFTVQLPIETEAGHLAS